MEKVDVVIVGAGFAGLSAAVELSSRLLLKVLIIEKERVGSNRTTPAVLIETLREYDLEEAILQSYSGFIHDSPSGVSAIIDFGRTVYASIDYEKACGILLRRAMLRGVQLVRSRAVDWIPREPDPDRPFMIRLENGHQVRTEVLIDGSGHTQLAAVLLGISPSVRYSHCFGQVLSGCTVDRQHFFRFLRPTKRYGNGGGWYYPINQKSVSIGYSVISKAPLIRSNEISEGYFVAKSEFQPYASWVADGKEERIEFGTVPVGRIGRFCANRILVAGDAAGQAHPWVIEGCRPALENGKLCANTVVSAFERGRFDVKHLFKYENEWKKINRERFWRAASLDEIQWSKTEDQWDDILRKLSKIPSEVVLRAMRDNHASSFQKAYAVAGHARRQFIAWLSAKKGVAGSGAAEE